MRKVFLDLSLLNKIGHDGLLYKLRGMGICGKYFRVTESFLSDRFQRVLLNSQTSN